MRARTLLLASALALGTPLAAGPAHAAARTALGVDIDGCSKPIPADAGFAVIQITDGKGFTQNPCLATAYAAARALPAPPQLYLDAADPDPSQTTHWPGGDCAGVASAACAHRYGRALADDALSTAASAGAGGADAMWWVDVENKNTWSSDTARNLAAISGVLDEIDTARRTGSVALAGVGIYSNHAQWDEITGGSGTLAWPVWSASPSADLAKASANCTDVRTRFTRGPVLMAQLLRPDGSDGDVVCPVGLKIPTALVGHDVVLTGRALPGTPVTVVVTRPDVTRTALTHATATGSWTLRITARYSAPIMINTRYGALTGRLTVKPVVSKPLVSVSVTDTDCRLTAHGVVQPYFPGQKIAVKVAHGRGATVSTHRAADGGRWRVSLAEPCGARLSVVARTTGFARNTHYSAAGSSAATTVQT